MGIGRFFLFLCVALALGAPASAQKIEIGEEGVSRPGGVYMSLRGEDAAACARVCETDGLCLAWTFLEQGVCDLKAIVPARIVQRGARSGLSPRAPDFARRTAIPRASPPPTPPPPVAIETSSPTPLPIMDTEGALLGGPSSDTPEALRPRLGAAGTW